MTQYRPGSVFELKYSHQRALAGGPKNVYSDKTAKTPPIDSSHPGLSSDMDVGRIENWVLCDLLVAKKTSIKPEGRSYYLHENLGN